MRIANTRGYRELVTEGTVVLWRQTITQAVLCAVRVPALTAVELRIGPYSSTLSYMGNRLSCRSPLVESERTGRRFVPCTFFIFPSFYFIFYFCSWRLAYFGVCCRPLASMSADGFVVVACVSRMYQLRSSYCNAPQQ